MTRARTGALLAAIGVAAAVSTPIAAAAQPGDAVRGRALYEARCFACHSPDAHRVGPAHRGVVGRRAGSAPGYAYSPALAAAAIEWTPANLERWLADPEALVPGQRMGYRVEQAEDRADLVAYLATLK